MPPAKQFNESSTLEPRQKNLTKIWQRCSSTVLLKSEIIISCRRGTLNTASAFLFLVSFGNILSHHEHSRRR